MMRYMIIASILISPSLSITGRNKKNDPLKVEKPIKKSVKFADACGKELVKKVLIEESKKQDEKVLPLPLPMRIDDDSGDDSAGRIQLAPLSRIDPKFEANVNFELIEKERQLLMEKEEIRAVAEALILLYATRDKDSLHN